MDPRRRVRLERERAAPSRIRRTASGSETSRLAPVARRRGSCCSSSASRAAESLRSSTPSQSSAVNSPRTAAPLEERALVLVERREDLAAQVVGHEAVVSAERAHGPRRIVDGPQPQPGEDERGGPALGALDEHVDLLRAELEMTEADEQLVRLGGREREIGRAHLGERTGRTQPREPERRIDAGEQAPRARSAEGARARSRSTPGTPRWSPRAGRRAR